jgi:hypothetical protein
MFPEDGHRVAFAGEDVNAYSVNSPIGCTPVGNVSWKWDREIDPRR